MSNTSDKIEQAFLALHFQRDEIGADGRNSYIASTSMSWTPTRIRWVTNTLETSTGAARVETDLGPAYAKLLGNPEGPQALFCDWVGTQAAKWLQLPTFDVAIVDVTVAGLVNYADGSKSKAGRAFLAREEAGTAWGGTPEELLSIENPDAMAGLVVLDTWLLNCDRYRLEGDKVRRNTRNVFLSGYKATKGKYRLVAMDHTHCFTCGREITKSIRNIDHVQAPQLYGHFEEFRQHLTHKAVGSYALRLGTLSSEDVEGFFARVPQAWNVPAEIRTNLSAFLIDRASFLARNIGRMLVEQGVLQPEHAPGD